MPCYLRYLVILVILILPARSSVLVNIDIQPSGAEAMSGGSFAVLPSSGSFWNTNGPNYQPQTLLLSDGTESGLSLTTDLYDAPFAGDVDVESVAAAFSEDDGAIHGIAQREGLADTGAGDDVTDLAGGQGRQHDDVAGLVHRLLA